MEVEGKVAIVTGAGGGIGAAIVERLAAAGARVVATDIRGDDVARVAAEIEAIHPGAVVGVQADATDGAAIDCLIDTAEKLFGGPDLYFANAGVLHGARLADDDAWRRAHEVNVMAPVRAAQAVVPRWLERGGGYFVVTASAAGLLTQVGLAPYAVTKHAAVGLAEWLAVTYGDHGIKVSCVCPMGVDTAMLRSGLEAEDEDDVIGARVVTDSGAVISPTECAESILAGIASETFLILPHPQVLDFYRRKVEDYDGWIAGMQRLRKRIDDADI